MTIVIHPPPRPFDLGLGILRAAFQRATPTQTRRQPVSPHIHALRQRDPEAWRAFVSEETPAIYRYVLGRMGNATDAEDVTGEVMEEAWRRAPG